MSGVQLGFLAFRVERGSGGREESLRWTVNAFTYLMNTNDHDEMMRKASCTAPLGSMHPTPPPHPQSCSCILPKMKLACSRGGGVRLGCMFERRCVWCYEMTGSLPLTQFSLKSGSGGGSVRPATRAVTPMSPG